MDISVARDRLARGVVEIEKKRPKVLRRNRYVRGEHDLPYAPKGVNEEYQDLRKQAIANYLDIATGAPVQRMLLDGIKLGLAEDDDKFIWRVLQANRFDARQRLPYQSMMSHGRGLVSVWPNKTDATTPIVRPESYELVHVEMDPDDPFTVLYAVKLYTIEDAGGAGSQLVLPEGVSRVRQVGIVYDRNSIVRFEKGGVANRGDWRVVLEGGHPMRRVPFALFDYKPDEKGQPWSALEMLMPQQDAINTIRFNTLLAMQFSAFRQRIVTGFDPRATDKDGNFLYKKNADGTPAVDGNGNAIPILNTPGRIGVDRLLAFPGGETKVFDLPESNLKNYIEVLDSFLVQFFSTAQLPPQYLLSQMSNIAEGALAAAESTLASLVKELQRSASEGVEDVAELVWFAAGRTDPFPVEAESLWADAEARSFAQIVDAITKLIAVDFPHKAAWEFIPGATSTKVDRWEEMRGDEVFETRLARAGRAFEDLTVPPVVDQTEIERGAAADGD